MKTIIQKVLVEDNHSFACRNYKTPHFETNWHKHPEMEIIVIIEGHGTVMIGDYIGAYKVGDVFFIASNLPHWFRKHHDVKIGSAVVAQYNSSIFGNELMQNPEMRNIHHLLQKDDGLRLDKKLRETVGYRLVELETAKGFNRFVILLDILHQISISKQSHSLSPNFNSDNKHINPAIEKIIEYTFKHYLEQIKLSEVAIMAKMSIPTFCRFFKKNIKKTYFEFIQELRINHACKLLKEEDKPIIEICYESGYNSWAHFSKQFKKITQKTPSVYKKEFRMG